MTTRGADANGGKRARRESGPARSRGFRIWLDDRRFQALSALAEAQGITRNALIERWIDEHSLQQAAPLPPDDVVQEWT